MAGILVGVASGLGAPALVLATAAGRRHHFAELPIAYRPSSSSLILVPRPLLRPLSVVLHPCSFTHCHPSIVLRQPPIALRPSLNVILPSPTAQRPSPNTLLLLSFANRPSLCAHHPSPTILLPSSSVHCPPPNPLPSSALLPSPIVLRQLPVALHPSLLLLLFSHIPRRPSPNVHRSALITLSPILPHPPLIALYPPPFSHDPIIVHRRARELETTSKFGF